MNRLDLDSGSSEGATVPVGGPAPTFDRLLATDGLRYSRTDFADRRALVVVFSSNRCPTAKAYGERMNALQRDYGPQGVQLLAVNSNDPHLYPDERLERMVERAAEDAYTFPYLVDAGQRLAKAFGATCTFHVFVVDAVGRIRYQGRFDDSRLAANVTSHDLADALDAILAGRDVRITDTRPFGCSLDFV
jgi:peroxiredoxin